MGKKKSTPSKAVGGEGAPPSKALSRPDIDRRYRQAVRHAQRIRLLNLIQGLGRWDAPKLTREFGCSERTIYRDLAALELAGVPWYFDQEARCYRVRAGFRFPQLNLTDDELLQQTVAAAVASVPGIAASAGSRTLLRKVADSSHEDRARLIDDAQRLIEVLGLKLADHGQCQEMLMAAQWALLRRKQVNGHYNTPHRRRPVRITLHPYRLCLVEQAWYLIGRSSESDRPKTYRVARFKTLRMTDATSDVPDAFDLQAYFGNAWSVFRGDRSFDVSVWFAEDAAPLVLETQWHATQRSQRHKDGAVTLSFQVDGLDEIVWWVLGWSGRAKVIGPPELREMVIANLHRALALHDSDD